MSADLDLQAWESLLRVHATIVALLDEEVEQATGLPLREYDVLLELSRADGGRLRMSILGQRVVLSRSRVSRLVDSMARDGLVEKHPDPSDGRAVLAVMTRKGRTAFRKAAPVYLDGIRRHFSHFLTRSEMTSLHVIFESLLDATDSE